MPAANAANDSITIRRAAETTGFSARMLRYVERLGLVAPGRSGSGYRLYGSADVQRLLALRQLLSRFQLELGEVGFARRMMAEPELREAIEEWLRSEPQRSRALQNTTTEAA